MHQEWGQNMLWGTKKSGYSSLIERTVADNLISTATTNAYILYHNFGSNQLAHFDFLVNVAHKLAGDFSAWKQ